MFITWCKESSPFACSPALKLFKLQLSCTCFQMAFRPTRSVVDNFYLLNRPYHFNIPYNLRNRFLRVRVTRAIKAHRSLHTALWPPLVFCSTAPRLMGVQGCRIRNAANYGAVHNDDNVSKQINLPRLYPSRTTLGRKLYRIIRRSPLDSVPRPRKNADGKKLSNSVEEIRLIQLHETTLLTILETK